jgi:hypothetical protein
MTGDERAEASDDKITNGVADYEFIHDIITSHLTGAFPSSFIPSSLTPILATHSHASRTLDVGDYPLYGDISR